MFTCLQRHHYNKAPLVWINMCLHWGKYSQHIYQLLQNYITVFDEYPVENTHSILWAQSPQTPLMNYAKKQKLFFSLRENSLTIHLSSHHQNSFVSSQLACIFKVKCAKVLTDMVKKSCTGPERGFFFHMLTQENWSCNISHHVFQDTSQDQHSASWIPL